MLAGADRAEAAENGEVTRRVGGVGISDRERPPALNVGAGRGLHVSDGVRPVTRSLHGGRDVGVALIVTRAARQEAGAGRGYGRVGARAWDHQLDLARTCGRRRVRRSAGAECRARQRSAGCGVATPDECGEQHRSTTGNVHRRTRGVESRRITVDVDVGVEERVVVLVQLRSRCGARCRRVLAGQDGVAANLNVARRVGGEDLVERCGDAGVSDI